MKIYKAAIIGLGSSGLAVNKLIYDNKDNEVIAFDNANINNRNNYFGFWLTNWMKPYENLIEKKWNSWQISNNNLKIIHSDENHPYCVISFENWKKFCLDTKNKFKLVNKKVIKYFPKENFYKIITEDNKEYLAEKIYDSRFKKKRNNELIQHFYGITINTNDNTFNDKKITLMHFTKVENFLHFIYILPFSHNKALIESTVFSKNNLSENWYKEQINKYLKENSINVTQELSYEKGIIPMFFADEKKSPYPNIFNIGIRGGACKASTGYAFAFLVKQIQLLKKTNSKEINIHSFIEKKMDQVFLNYLKNNNEYGDSFIKIAKNLNGNEFQDFMMGQSTFKTKFKIIKSMPKFPFIKALFG